MKPQMQLLNIALDDNELLPEFVMVAMTVDVAERIAEHVPDFSSYPGKVAGEHYAHLTVDRAARICKTFGHMTPTDEYTGVIWDCLAGSLFNRFYDNGVDEFLEV